MNDNVAGGSYVTHRAPVTRCLDAVRLKALPGSQASQPITPMPSSFLHLPNELILEILGYHEGSPLEDDTIQNLALSCRRLFALLISTILLRQLNHLRNLTRNNKFKIFETEQFCWLRSEQLDMDIYGSSLNSISYNITHTVAKDLRCLHGLIARASQVRHVKLTLEMSMYEQTIMGPIPEGGIEVFSSLFNVCVEKEGLSLSVNGEPMVWDGEGGPFKYEVTTSPQSTIAPPASRRRDIRRSLRTEKTDYYKRFWELFSPILPNFGTPKIAEKSEGSVEDPPQPAKTQPFVVIISPHITSVANYERTNPFLNVHDPKLSGIEINSRIFFRSSWYATTLKLLNTAPITQLSFGNTGLNIYDWAQILPSITIPGLTEFTTGESGIAFPDLFTFLQRHPSITKLVLSNSFCIGRVELPASSTPFLPCLTKLVGAAEYLAPLLRDKDDYPVLESVRLTQESTVSIRWPGFQQDQVNEFIRNLSLRSSPGPQELCLHLRYEEGLEEWLTTSALEPFNEAVRNLKCVKKLAVQYNCPNWSPKTQEKLIAWIMLLPCVEEVKLSEADFKSNAPEWPAWQAYGNLIWSQCPHLRKIGIGSRMYSRDD